MILKSCTARIKNYKKKGDKVYNIPRLTKRAFVGRLRSIDFKHCPSSGVYLKAYYGKSLDQFGNMTPDINEGRYYNHHDLMIAVEAFLEED